MALNLLAPVASAQPVSFGVVAGAYANRDFVETCQPGTPGFLPSILHSDSGGYIVGPAIEVRLFPRLSLGVEALYKPLRYSAFVGYFQDVMLPFAPATVVTWQYPLLARYRFSSGRARPFLEGGPSLRTAGNLNAANPSRFGLTAGAGVETEWRRLRIAPRVRYTRWRPDPDRAGARTRPDQAEFLVGFAYAAPSSAYPLGRRMSLGMVFGTTFPDEGKTYTGVIPEYALTGAPLTIQQRYGPRRYWLGPLVEFSLSSRFSLEAGAIARSSRTVRTVTSPTFGAHRSSGSFALPWEFPVLAKYRLTNGSVRPFLAAGESFRLPGQGLRRNYGATAGVGLETRRGRIRIAPALRYTRWRPPRSIYGAGLADPSARRDYVQLLVSISF